MRVCRAVRRPGPPARDARGAARVRRRVAGCLRCEPEGSPREAAGGSAGTSRIFSSSTRGCASAGLRWRDVEGVLHRERAPVFNRARARWLRTGQLPHAPLPDRLRRGVAGAAHARGSPQPEGSLRHVPSQLLTAGVQLGWISRQLGHADVATTAQHYARWAGGDAYRLPLEIAPGEIPADLLARIEALESHHESPHFNSAGGA